MIGVNGERLYGQVDRVAGLFYVSTLFWHISYLPIIPLRSYIVLEGSEDGDNFQGKQINFRLKSILVGYLRGWLGATALLPMGFSGMAGTTFVVGHTHFLAVLLAMAIAGGLSWCVWFVMTTRHPLFLVVQAALLVASIACFLGCNWIAEQEPALMQVELRQLQAIQVSLAIGTGALFLFSLTRFATAASFKQALRLADEIGIPREVVAARFVLKNESELMNDHTEPDAPTDRSSEYKQSY